MKISSIRALAGMLLASALSGCGGDQPNASARPAADPVRAPGLKIVMIAKNNTNPVFVSARTGANAAAKELAAKHNVPIQIVWMTPDREDAALQTTAIAQAVNDRADAILISCSDADGVTPAIDQAVAKGVPVMTFDSDAAKSKRFAFYGVDDEKLGETVMRELAGQIRSGAVAILAGNADAPNLRKRVDGVTREASRHRGIRIVGTYHHTETPVDAASEVMREQAANPRIRGWAMVGSWALLTPRLMTELDPKKVTVVAVNALPSQLPYLENGLAPVLLALPTYNWGYVSVQRIFDKVHLKQDVPEMLPPMEVVKVTKESLPDWTRQLKAWGFSLPDKYTKGT